jgi:hypothetical protein
MTNLDRTMLVPKQMQAAFDRINALIGPFCRNYLNDEYCELAQRMAAMLGRKRSSPLISGEARTWACAILYALGKINFLSDPSTQPYMTMADLCKAFGVGQSTASAKANIILRSLQTHQLDPKWSLSSLLDMNPLVWMVEINGILIDLRDMPREVQETAYSKGVIPYIPADRD